MTEVVKLLLGLLRAKIRALMWLLVLAFGTILFFVFSSGASSLTIGLVVVVGCLLIALAAGLLWFWSRVFSNALKATPEHHKPSDRNL
ncbi:MAG: hypothetical protein ACRDBH_00525 [Bosea sp. (in: a-proteobacteria)]